MFKGLNGKKSLSPEKFDALLGALLQKEHNAKRVDAMKAQAKKKKSDK